MSRVAQALILALGFVAWMVIEAFVVALWARFALKNRRAVV
jgi:hypothetical protein